MGGLEQLVRGEQHNARPEATITSAEKRQESQWGPELCACEVDLM